MLDCTILGRNICKMNGKKTEIRKKKMVGDKNEVTYYKTGLKYMSKSKNKK